MKAVLSLLLLLSSCTELSLTQIPSCSRSPPPQGQVDCSSMEAGECLVERANFTEPIPDPDPNTRSCYRTCIQPNDPFPPSCIVDRIPFENNGIVRVRGPNDREVFTTFRLFSPNFRRGTPYLNNVECRYHIRCEEEIPGSIMSINFQQQSLETELPCNGEDECVDFVRIRLPFGNICTSCDHLPVSCREVETGFSVSQMLHFDGNESLVMEFQSNRDERFTGFEFMVTCVQEAYFISPGCSTPPELNDTSRRRRDANFMEDMSDTPIGRQHAYIRDLVAAIFPRQKRSAFRVVWFEIPASADVTYEEYTVQVIGEGIQPRTFPNIRYFQVFNFAEGYQTFYRDAPPGRTFPGYGVLVIGWEVIQFIQTGIKSHLLPSPAETAIIVNLQRRIVQSVDEPDIDIRDAQDGAAIPGMYPTLNFTKREIAEMDEQARMFDNACNGILRATCCVYQQQFFPQGPEPDCFVGLP